MALAKSAMTFLLLLLAGAAAMQGAELPAEGSLGSVDAEILPSARQQEKRFQIRARDSNFFLPDLADDLVVFAFVNCFWILIVFYQENFVTSHSGNYLEYSAISTVNNLVKNDTIY